MICDASIAQHIVLKMPRKRIRPLKIVKGGIAHIPLPDGSHSRIDLVDYDVANLRNWHSSNGYAKTRENGKDLYLHNAIMRPSNGFVVDHINGDKLDNRRKNLRICTHTENMWNQKKRKNNTSGHKGVTKRNDLYEAEIRVHGVRHYLGSFDTAKEASRAYQAASKRFHGEFARIK